MRTRFLPAYEALEPREVPAADFRTLPIYPVGDLAVLDHVHAVAAIGQSLGRQTNVFLKIGDSNTELEPLGENGYLRPLGGTHNPNASGLSGHGANLVQTWSTFFGSFARNDRTAGPGYQIPSVFPYLESEIASKNPGVALIMLGTNDATVGTAPNAFRSNLITLLDRIERAGVVPILSTIPENLFNGAATAELSRLLNQVIADVAEDEHIPLWNLHRQLSGLPSSGLGPDRLHLNQSPAGGASFHLGDLLYGQNVHNLGALTVLDWYRTQIVSGIPSLVPSLPAWTSLAGHAVYAVGRDAGQGPTVSVYDATTRAELNRFNAFETSFRGGVRVATGDVNGDGVVDIVCAAGPTGGPVVTVFSGADGSRIASFFAFEGSFRGGIGSVAVKDLDGDGIAEIAVGAGNGGGPVIAIYNGGDFKERQRFLAYDGGFRGGVNVTLGTFEGIGETIVAGAGVGGGPHVKLFALGSFTPVRSFFAEVSEFAGGIVVAAGDLTGDEFDELATGRYRGGSSVHIWDPVALRVRRSIAPRTVNTLAGVRLAVTGDALLVGNGYGATVRLDAYSSLNANPIAIPPDDPLRAYGIFVG